MKMLWVWQVGQPSAGISVVLVLMVLGLQVGPPGPVRELTFEPAADGRGLIIRWRPPADLPAEQAHELRYEIEDRGVGPWRTVHSGPETRLPVLELRAGACRVRVRALALDGAPGPWQETDCTVSLESPAARTTEPAPCPQEAGVVCLFGNRFAVRVYRLVDGHEIDASPELPDLDDNASRHFRFAHSQTPTSVHIRILDLCGRNGHFGLEYRVEGNVEFRVGIRDLYARQRKSFLAPAGRDRPPRVAFNEVFATCD